MIDHAKESMSSEQGHSKRARLSDQNLQAKQLSMQMLWFYPHHLSSEQQQPRHGSDIEVVFELIASNYCYPTYVGEASGCHVVNDFVTFQVAAICGLIGMTLGWRGVMTKYSGFYDLPTAWNQVFWGILLGGAFASYADTLFSTMASLSGERTAELNIIRLFLPLIATIGMHFFCVESEYEKGFTVDKWWALGLAVGGMLPLY